MTRTISRFSYAFWLITSLLMAYITYNPWFSMADLMQLSVPWPIKIVIAGFYCGIMLLYITEGQKSLSPMGLLVLGSILSGMVATLLNSHLLSWGSAQWWIQIPFGLALFFALRWGAIYRAITGRVPVGTPNDGEPHHHA